jgi:hypothetical protein
VRRNLGWSIDTAEKLKLPTAGLKSLLNDVNADRVNFTAMASRMASLLSEMEAESAKSINPGAAAFFIMGVHHNGAERVAEGARQFAREDKPGTGALIERQLVRLADGTSTIKVSLKPVLDIQDALRKGATFADLANRLAKLRQDWQDELAAQPGFSGGPGTGAAITGTFIGSETLAGFGRLEFRFAANGQVTMVDARQTVAGSYTVNGNNVTLTFFNGGCVYTGAISGQTLSGTGRNTASGTTWNFTVSR